MHRMGSSSSGNSYEDEKLQRKVYMAKKRANETQEQAELRRIRNRERAKLRRAQETEEEAEQRRIKNRQYAAMKRARESAQETEMRRIRNRNYQAWKRSQSQECNKHSQQYSTTVSSPNNGANSSYQFVRIDLRTDDNNRYVHNISDQQLERIAEQILERNLRALRTNPQQWH